jgi:hypothetical protein
MSTIVRSGKMDEAADAPGRQARNEQIVRSLKALFAADEQEQRDTFEYLRRVLDEDRPSNRKLFRQV